MEDTPAKWLLPTLTDKDAFDYLPVPRFQMVVQKHHGARTWHYRVWPYSLVYKDLTGKYLNRPFNQTADIVRTNIADPIPVLENHEMPMRDGANMLYEAKMLKLPAFLILINDGEVSTIPVFLDQGIH